MSNGVNIVNRKDHLIQPSKKPPAIKILKQQPSTWRSRLTSYSSQLSLKLRELSNKVKTAIQTHATAETLAVGVLGITSAITLNYYLNLPSSVLPPPSPDNAPNTYDNSTEPSWSFNETQTANPSDPLLSDWWNGKTLISGTVAIALLGIAILTRCRGNNAVLPPPPTRETPKTPDPNLNPSEIRHTGTKEEEEDRRQTTSVSGGLDQVLSTEQQKQEIKAKVKDNPEIIASAGEGVLNTVFIVDCFLINKDILEHLPEHLQTKETFEALFKVSPKNEQSLARVKALSILKRNRQTHLKTVMSFYGRDEGFFRKIVEERKGLLSLGNAEPDLLNTLYEAMEHADPQLKNDKAFMKEMIGSDPRCIEHTLLKDDFAFVKEVIRDNHEVFPFLKDDKYTNDTFFEQLVKLNGSVLKYGKMDQIQNRTLVKVAVKQNKGALIHAHNNLRKEKAFALELAKEGLLALNCIDPDLQSDEEILAFNPVIIADDGTIQPWSGAKPVEFMKKLLALFESGSTHIEVQQRDHPDYDAFIEKLKKFHSFATKTDSFSVESKDLINQLEKAAKNRKLTERIQNLENMKPDKLTETNFKSIQDRKETLNKLKESLDSIKFIEGPSKKLSQEDGKIVETFIKNAVKLLYLTLERLKWQLPKKENSSNLLIDNT